MFERLGGWLVDPAGFTRPGPCPACGAGLLWTYAVSDAGIAVGYFTIFLALTLFAHRRRDPLFPPLRPVLLLFTCLILLGGVIHFLDVLTLGVPAYWLEAGVKAVTAVASIVTAVLLWSVLSKALAFSSTRQLEEANAALRESEGRYRVSFDHSPVPMHTLDQDGVLTGVSRSWLALLGYAEEEVIGHHVSDFRPSSANIGVADDIRTLLAEGEIYDRERHYLRRDGTIVDVLMSARREHRNGSTGFVCVLIDVTERRRAEEALRASEERLHQAQKMEAVGQLTGGIAHDFNNMLQGITGALDLTERRLAQGRPAEVGRYIATARRAADHATALTNRMLAFARRQALQPTVIEPDALLRGMTGLIRSGVGSMVRLELDQADGKWTVACDAGQLESALLNLVINARDAMPEGGTLKISSADRTMTLEDLADQDGIRPGDYAEIALSDTGTGMTPDVLSHAFEPFFTTKPFSRGTGLGLSQVYGFVRQSGGFVRLDSKLNQGTTVRLYLPRKDRPVIKASETPETTTAPAHAVAANPLGSTVLVVEDEARVREMIVGLLSEEGYSVMDADDGPSGLRIVQSPARIDLLLTDIGLPGLNGRQLADAARTTRPALPVLLITGYAGTALDNKELAPNMQILRKPFAFDILRARVREMIAPSL
jgi:PAS domain S-box-containing protein